MATPHTTGCYWKAIVNTEWGERPEPGRWRNPATDPPPPAPPTEVFWLAREGKGESHYMNQVAQGAEASFRGPQKP
jgi:hypothetical protein